jgi:hypothetical protein
MVGGHWVNHFMTGSWMVGPCGPARGHRHGWSKEEMISMLEEYQRDLEQEVADVAERIKRLKEDKAEV